MFILLCISVCTLLAAVIVNIHTWLTKTEKDYDFIFRQVSLLLFCVVIIIFIACFFPKSVTLLPRLAIATLGGAIVFFLSSITTVLIYRNRD